MGWMKRLAVVAAWFAGTVLSATVAWAMVGLAGERVGDEVVAPLSVQQVEDLAAGLTTTSSPQAQASTTVPTTTMAGEPATTTIAAPGDTAADPVTEAHRVTGGTVVIRYTGRWVELVSATPEQGFGVEVKSVGPERVDVEFDAGETETRFVAEPSDDGVVVEVTEGD